MQNIYKSIKVISANDKEFASYPETVRKSKASMAVYNLATKLAKEQKPVFVIPYKSESGTFIPYQALNLKYCRLHEENPRSRMTVTFIPFARRDRISFNMSHVNSQMAIWSVVEYDEEILKQNIEEEKAAKEAARIAALEAEAAARKAYEDKLAAKAKEFIVKYQPHFDEKRALELIKLCEELEADNLSAQNADSYFQGCEEMASARADFRAKTANDYQSDIDNMIEFMNVRSIIDSKYYI
jgi:hypothetical protein